MIASGSLTMLVPDELEGRYMTSEARDKLLSLKAKEELLAMQVSDTRTRVRTMRRQQKLLSRRIESAIDNYDQIERVRPCYERILKRQETQLGNVRRLIREVE